MLRWVLWALGITLAIAWATGCTQGQTTRGPEEFYRGKTITWVLSAGAGSGSDLLGRAIAPYLAKETGTTVKTENPPSDQGDNYVFVEAKPDGLTLLINSTSATLSNDILKAPGVLYETEKFNFVADANPSTKVFQISPKLSPRTLATMREAKGLKAGGTTAKGSFAISAAVLFEMLQLDGKIVTGYQAKKELILSVARGEIDIVVGSDNTAKKDEEDGYLVNLFVLANDRSKAVPNAPTMVEFGANVPKELEAAYKYVAASGTAVALPPGVPQDRVDYLRKVFDRLRDNKELQKDVEKVTGVWSPFGSGKQLQDEIIAIKANKALATQLDAILGKYKATQ